jgi:RimJ/RimL family protein N-acetyltransferase
MPPAIRGAAATESSSVPSSDAFVIRRAHPRDAAALVELAQEIAAEPEGWLISDGGWRTAADERRYLKAIRRYRDAAVFVAELIEHTGTGLILSPSTRNEIVGRMSLGRDPHPASRHVADLGLMVAAGARRQGIGRALLEQAVAWAQEVGVRKLELHVFPHNDAAIALYDGFGFEREGYRKAHYRRGRDFVDAILMAYDIPPQHDG